VTFGEQLTAVCGCHPNDCLDLEIADENAEVLEVSPGGVRRALAFGLALDSVDGAPPARRPVLRLGERRFGSSTAAFWFAPRLDDRLLDWIELLRMREHERTPAVVVPRTAAVEPTAADCARRLGLCLLPLDRLLDVSSGHVDLTEFVMRHRFVGLDPGEVLGRRFRLVLDPDSGRYWRGGKRLEQLERWPRTAAFLVELARTPDSVVDRDQLCRVLWPDEFGARGWQEIDWDRRIRDQRRRITKACGDLPVAARAAGPDVGGGYALDLPSSEVAWWSQPA